METDETIKKGFLRLERYAQNIPGGFHCCAEDPENGYPFAYVSDRFLEILGWEREEFAARFDNRPMNIFLICATHWVLSTWMNWQAGKTVTTLKSEQNS